MLSLILRDGSDLTSRGGLYAVSGDKPEFCILAKGDAPQLRFSAEHLAPEPMRTQISNYIERALSIGGQTDQWPQHRQTVAAFLRGLPVGEDSSVSIRPPQFEIIEEPFSRAPAPDELERAVLENEFYRRVLYTSREGFHQEVAMCARYWLPPEVHTDTDQYFLVKSGEGETIVDGRVTKIRPLSAFWVERGSRHEIRVNPDHGPMKLFVSYAKAHHPKGRVDRVNTDLLEVIERGVPAA